MGKEHFLVRAGDSHVLRSRWITELYVVEFLFRGFLEFAL